VSDLEGGGQMGILASGADYLGAPQNFLKNENMEINFRTEYKKKTMTIYVHDWVIVQLHTIVLRTEIYLSEFF